MWYRIMDRTKPYIRLYKKQNLWFDIFSKKGQIQKGLSYFDLFLFRFSKNYANYTVSVVFLGFSFLYLYTYLASFPKSKSKQLTLSEQFDLREEDIAIQSIKKNNQGLRTLILEKDRTLPVIKSKKLMGTFDQVG